MKRRKSVKRVTKVSAFDVGYLPGDVMSNHTRIEMVENGTAPWQITEDKDPMSDEEMDKRVAAQAWLQEQISKLGNDDLAILHCETSGGFYADLAKMWGVTTGAVYHKRDRLFARLRKNASAAGHVLEF